MDFDFCWKWFSREGNIEKSERVCSYRDVFQARLYSLKNQFKAVRFSENEWSLLIAVLGEIGNNSFDHNSGVWNDIPGCLLEVVFQASENRFYAVIADRGQGICSSLKRVIPHLNSDQEALEIAFQKIISGREPEKRGNGLKFVSKILNQNSLRGLICISGDGILKIGRLGNELNEKIESLVQNQNKQGTFTMIAWDVV